MCGKDIFRKCKFYFTTGSPPRVREGLCKGHFCFKRFRITPACAGRTRFTSYFCLDFWDHPRVCGKDSNLFKLVRLNSGSPPRVREGRTLISNIQIAQGITPACAGRTAVIAVILHFIQDHPRVCGKDQPNTLRLYLLLGSPPRVREGLTWVTAVPMRVRITPACAGRTHLIDT